MATLVLSRLLRAAMAAADQGWPVFPLIPGGKGPALSRWQHQATVDTDVLTRWWRRVPFNIGVACGPAGLLVVDLDGIDGRVTFASLAGRAGSAPTFTVATPSGGEHRYYTVDWPARSTVGRLGRHVDTRGAGGYIVAAGSVRHLDAGLRHYRISDPTPPRPLPDWLAALLRPMQSCSELYLPQRPADRHRRTAYGRVALAGETAIVRRAVPGRRNSTLFHAAVRLGTLVGAGVLDEADVRAELIRASTVHIGRNGFTAAEADRTVANGLRYGLARPRPKPRIPSRQGPSPFHTLNHPPRS